MSRRNFNLPKNVDAVKPCPNCGQKTQFVCVSKQVCEDGCEVWIECVCGHDPHKFNERYESVMGGCSEENVRAALDCWNSASGHNVHKLNHNLEDETAVVDTMRGKIDK